MILYLGREVELGFSSVFRVFWVFVLLLCTSVKPSSSTRGLLLGPEGAAEDPEGAAGGPEGTSSGPEGEASECPEGAEAECLSIVQVSQGSSTWVSQGRWGFHLSNPI